MNAQTSRSLAALSVQRTAPCNAPRSRHQRAAHTALEPPLRWPLVPSACPVASLDTYLRQGTKTEGKIKEPARLPLKSQSAHGVGTARRLCRSVPRNVCMPRVRSLASVPSAVHCATLRWSLRRGSQ